MTGIGKVTTNLIVPAIKIALPIGVTIGTQYLAGKLIGSPSQGSAVPAPLQEPVSQAQSTQRESNIHMTTGILAAVAVVVVILATRRK